MYIFILNNLNVLGKREGEMGVLVRDHGTGEFDASDVFGPVGPEWVPVQNDQVLSLRLVWRLCDLWYR